MAALRTPFDPHRPPPRAHEGDRPVVPAPFPFTLHGTFSIAIEPGAIYTYTSVPSAHPGAAAWLEASAAAGGCAAMPPMAPGDMWPPEAPFPLPYYDVSSVWAITPHLGLGRAARLTTKHTHTPPPSLALTVLSPHRTLRATPTTRCRPNSSTTT